MIRAVPATFPFLILNICHERASGIVGETFFLLCRGEGAGRREGMELTG